MRVIYFGTPEFAANVLTFLLDHAVDVVAVLTKPDRPKGRSRTPLPTPVKVIAENHKIPVFQPEVVSDPYFASTLEAFNADLFVVVAYGEIIKQHLLDMPKKGCINLHASLLPKYRGAAPIQRAIIQGESHTGVTIIHMAKKMDAGDIIQIVEVPIAINDSFLVVENALCVVGSQAVLDVIHAFESGRVNRVPQDHSLATFASKIELEDCEVIWSLPALTLHNLVRGVTPEPGAWCYVWIRGQKKRLKILETRLVEAGGQPADLLCYGKHELVVACGNGALNIKLLQLEGKKQMTAEELMRGIPQADISFGTSS